MYWRGVEEDVRVFTQNVNTWPENLYFVRLVEPQLHSSQLDVIGTSEFKEILEKEGPDGLYKIIYELVMTCDSQSSELQVDYSPFLNKFGEVRADTATAIRVGATSNTVLGDVARRVAADACYYVFRDGDVELRAGNHVRCINDCIENAAKTYCLDTGAIESDSIA